MIRNSNYYLIGKIQIIHYDVRFESEILQRFFIIIFIHLLLFKCHDPIELDSSGTFNRWIKKYG